jgi:hypothetical protein
VPDNICFLVSSLSSPPSFLCPQSTIPRLPSFIPHLRGLLTLSSPSSVLRLLPIVQDTALCRQSAYSDRTVHISAHRVYTGPSSTSVASSLERRIRLTATTQTTRHRPYALYDRPVPHPARCAPSRSLHPHSGVADSVLAHALDTALSRIGYNSHLHLHAQCTLPPHPFSAPPFSLSPPSPSAAPRTTTAIATHHAHHTPARRRSSRSRRRHRYLHGSATVFSTCPSPPSSLPRSLNHPRRPYGRTRPVAAQRPQRSNTRPTAPSSDACVFAAWQPSDGCALHIVPAR